MKKPLRIQVLEVVAVHPPSKPAMMLDLPRIGMKEAFPEIDGEAAAILQEVFSLQESGLIDAKTIKGPTGLPHTAAVFKITTAGREYLEQWQEKERLHHEEIKRQVPPQKHPLSKATLWLLGAVGSAIVALIVTALWGKINSSHLENHLSHFWK